jgi:hypothetical protein
MGDTSITGPSAIARQAIISTDEADIIRDRSDQAQLGKDIDKLARDIQQQRQQRQQTELPPVPPGVIPRVFEADDARIINASKPADLKSAIKQLKIDKDKSKQERGLALLGLKLEFDRRLWGNKDNQSKVAGEIAEAFDRNGTSHDAHLDRVDLLAKTLNFTYSGHSYTVDLNTGQVLTNEQTSLDISNVLPGAPDDIKSALHSALLDVAKEYKKQKEAAEEQRTIRNQIPVAG